MDNIRTLQGDVIARDLRIAIIASRFNDAIVDLSKGITVITVPSGRLPWRSIAAIACAVG